MSIRRAVLVLVSAFVLGLPLSVDTVAQGNDKAPADVVVQFGSPTNLAGGAPNQIVVPDEVTVRNGGRVTFIVNGPGHGLAIYAVSKDTTRDDISAQLCPHDPVTNACTDPGFANADHAIHDAKGGVIIQTDTNPPTARINDPTDRLFATSIQIEAVPTPFLTGTAAPGFTTNPGTAVQYQFTATGRYLVMCVNRAHALSNWMFGFVKVVGQGNDQQ